MASTNSTIDGMGFEEMGQVGSQTPSTWIAGSFTAELGITTHKNLFATGSVYGTDAIVTKIDATIGSLTNLRVTTPTTTQGVLYSVQVGSPVSYSGIVKTGSLITSAGSQGFVKFGTSFASANGWYVNLSPCGSIAGYEESYLSGLRHASGINMVGAADLRYDWIAIGA